MKIGLAVLLILGACVLAEASKEECMFNNFKKLFSKAQQQFIYDLLELTKDKDGTDYRKKVLKMDSHGDKVLEDWANCKKCPVPPCRSPFLSKISAGSNDMTRMLQEYLTLVKNSNDRKLFRKSKKIVDKALDDNKKALNC